MTKFNVASIINCTEVEGPYKRLCIWFQGCDIHCPECCNASYQPLIPRNLMDIEELIDVIIEAKKRFDIEGVTYSGGEPTLQKGLPELTRRIKELRLGVISFTGHLYEEVKDVLEGCDAVIDGPFISSLLDEERRILGSSNQRIICLTDRYKGVIEEWFASFDSKAVEINIGDNILMSGDKI